MDRPCRCCLDRLVSPGTSDAAPARRQISGDDQFLPADRYGRRPPPRFNPLLVKGAGPGKTGHALAVFQGDDRSTSFHQSRFPRSSSPQQSETFPPKIKPPVCAFLPKSTASDKVPPSVEEADGEVPDCLQKLRFLTLSGYSLPDFVTGPVPMSRAVSTVAPSRGGAARNGCERRSRT